MIESDVHAIVLIPFFALGLAAGFGFRAFVFAAGFFAALSAPPFSSRLRASRSAFGARGRLRRFDRYDIRRGHRRRGRKRAAQAHGRFLRKHQPVVPQQVVGLQARAAQPASRLRDCGWRVPDSRFAPHLHQQHRLACRRPACRAPARNGLVLCESSCQPSTTVSFCSRQLRRQRRTQRAQNHLLRQRVGVSARNRPVHRAALAPDRASESSRRARGPCPSASRAFGPSRDTSLSSLGLVRAGALRRQISAHGFVQQVRVHLRAETRRRPARPARRSCLRRFFMSTTGIVVSSFLGLFVPFSVPCFAPCESRCSCPPGPAPRRAPAADFRPRPFSRRADSSIVLRSLPMCPGKCWPFQTRDGNELAPMPPGAR